MTKDGQYCLINVAMCGLLIYITETVKVSYPFIPNALMFPFWIAIFLTFILAIVKWVHVFNSMGVDTVTTITTISPPTGMKRGYPSSKRSGSDF